MSYDAHGQQFLTEDELMNLIHINPELNLANVLLDDPCAFNEANSKLYSGYAKIKQYIEPTTSIEDFDLNNQSTWNMPAKYKDFDIMYWLINEAVTEEEINRVAEELVLYEERNLIPLLQFLKYMIDTFRAKDIVWGVGRGSSVSSYVLYLLGVHKINSLVFNLEVREFLR